MKPANNYDQLAYHRWWTGLGLVPGPRPVPLSHGGLVGLEEWPFMCIRWILLSRYDWNQDPGVSTDTHLWEAVEQQVMVQCHRLHWGPEELVWPHVYHPAPEVEHSGPSAARPPRCGSHDADWNGSCKLFMSMKTLQSITATTRAISFDVYCRVQVRYWAAVFEFLPV